MFWFVFIKFFMISAISQVKCDTRKFTENLSNYVDSYNGTNDPRWSIVMENQGKTYRRIKPNDTDDFTVSYTNDRGASTVLRIRLSVQKVGGEQETIAAGDGQLLGSMGGQYGPETTAANGTATAVGSTAAPNCTATTVGSTFAPNGTANGAGSTSTPNGTATAAGSTSAPNGTANGAGSTSAPNGTATAAGSTSAPNGTVNGAGSTFAPNGTVNGAGSTFAPNGTVATTTPNPRPTDGGRNYGSNSSVADDDNDDDDDNGGNVANDPPRLARVASALPVSRNSAFDDDADDDDRLVLVVENDIRLKLFLSPRAAAAVPSLDFGSADREDATNSPSPTTTPPPHPRSARSAIPLTVF